MPELEQDQSRSSLSPSKKESQQNTLNALFRNLHVKATTVSSLMLSILWTCHIHTNIYFLWRLRFPSSFAAVFLIFFTRLFPSEKRNHQGEVEWCWRRGKIVYFLESVEEAFGFRDRISCLLCWLLSVTASSLYPKYAWWFAALLYRN